MHLLRRSRIRIRLDCLRNERRRFRHLLKTKYASQAMLPLLPWFVATSVQSSAFLQLALFIPGLLLTSAWVAFVLHALVPLIARLENRRYMQVERYLLPAEYHR